MYPPPPLPKGPLCPRRTPDRTAVFWKKKFCTEPRLGQGGGYIYLTKECFLYHNCIISSVKIFGFLICFMNRHVCTCHMIPYFLFGHSISSVFWMAGPCYQEPFVEIAFMHQSIKLWKWLSCLGTGNTSSGEGHCFFFFLIVSMNCMISKPRGKTGGIQFFFLFFF